MSWLDTETVNGVLGADLAAAIDGTAMQAACDAVRPFVERKRADLFAGDPAVFTPAGDVLYGAVLLAYRWYDRRRTPTGLLDAGEGAAEILRHDPDIARLLGIGPAGPFVFGSTPPPATDTTTGTV